MSPHTDLDEEDLTCIDCGHEATVRGYNEKTDGPYRCRSCEGDFDYDYYAGYDLDEWWDVDMYRDLGHV